MFLHKNEEYEQATEDFSSTQLIIAKHRNGPTGTINLGFRKQISQFVSMTKQVEPAPTTP